MLLICIEGNGRLSGDQATDEETGQAFGDDDDKERDEVLY